mmetsp:Transcript_4174/g.10642  ORF Transcript_4174/g.10642 Transcript_4174/m.10642 type:complete len:228 (-) Transcript_4174:1003-1686(-)
MGAAVSPFSPSAFDTCARSPPLASSFVRSACTNDHALITPPEPMPAVCLASSRTYGSQPGCRSSETSSSRHSSMGAEGLKRGGSSEGCARRAGARARSQGYSSSANLALLPKAGRRLGGAASSSPEDISSAHEEEAACALGAGASADAAASRAASACALSSRRCACASRRKRQKSSKARSSKPGPPPMETTRSFFDSRLFAEKARSSAHRSHMAHASVKRCTDFRRR